MLKIFLILRFVDIDLDGIFDSDLTQAALSTK